MWYICFFQIYNSFLLQSVFLELVAIFSKNLSKSEEEQTIIVLKRILSTISDEKNKLNSAID